MARRGRTHSHISIRLSGRNIFLLFIPLMLILGIVAGFMIRNNFIKAKYEFKLNGDEVVRLKLGEEYVEQGCVVISMNKDCSEDIKIIKPEFDGVGTYVVRYELDEEMYIERLVIISE